MSLTKKIGLSIVALGVLLLAWAPWMGDSIDQTAKDAGYVSLSWAPFGRKVTHRSGSWFVLFNGRVLSYARE